MRLGLRSPQSGREHPREVMDSRCPLAWNTIPGGQAKAIFRPTDHAVSRTLCSGRWGRGGGSFFLEGQGLPSPQIPDPPASPHLSDYQGGLEGPTHPYSWTLGPCTPMGLWLQTLHHAQGQLGAWQPEATDPDTVLVIIVSPLPSAGPLLRPLSTMVVPLFPASPITFMDPIFQSQLFLLLNSTGTGTGPLGKTSGLETPEQERRWAGVGLCSVWATLRPRAWTWARADEDQVLRAG